MHTKTTARVALYDMIQDLDWIRDLCPAHANDLFAVQMELADVAIAICEEEEEGE